MARDIRFRSDGFRFNYRAAGIMIENGHVLIHKQVDDTFWALPGGGLSLARLQKKRLLEKWQRSLGMM
ncbi:NUDIX hydrolase [Halobacillus karajensis]|uniref:Nudix hydrolase domain-containing protein n=1 Tax=Halobacillus karajensis TaxID=195088 RepID=A0A059NVQ0_9BACI|nr:hypothetical protein [Halobacillus karajensis]CDQ18449.1 hypothetical protein BN982_00721 [Halobacillus karajensis]CDQ23479.1 hypothetical protein BN983_01707 [Halobacillus karajensis]CDQ26961.1 hypothetical protein BN981_01187 [Halobacillus karajensis]